MSVGQTGIIIQARMGSTRMPGKVLQPFYGTDSILDIIVRKLQNNNFSLPVVLATSDAASDDVLKVWADKNSVPVFRGSEQNVLDRFVQTAEFFGFTNVIRVCADNPFLDESLLKELIDTALRVRADYISYEAAPDIPAMKSHLGVFAEWVSLDALKKAQSMTTDKLYTEHVTNFIYGNPDRFTVRWIKAPPEIYNRNDVRFTIDTIEDFNLMQRLYSVLANSGRSPNFINVLQVVETDSVAMNTMRNQIRNFTK